MTYEERDFLFSEVPEEEGEKLEDEPTEGEEEIE